jgi:hypothetical protein
MTEEFKQIAHSGGRITINVITREDGGRAYSTKYEHCRPVAAAICAVHAIPPGIPISMASLGGYGSSVDRGPIPGSVEVYIASDSEGMFGRQCPACNGYWRARSQGHVCPYCGLRAGGHSFMTEAQHSYLQQYFTLFSEAINESEDGDHVIDLDAVADAANSEEKPPFYYAEESQQNKFLCGACGSLVDILGRFGYCSTCGTRNDLQDFEVNTLPKIRERINSGGPYESCVKEAVGAFDSFVGQYMKELVRQVPMTPGRKNRYQKMRFHDLSSVVSEWKQVFDIDIVSGLKPDDRDFAILMFHRRHVYEHKGGEADAKYITESGDAGVRVKQALSETRESAHRTVGIIARMATNLHSGFHEIIPPIERPIAAHKRRH